MIFSQYPLSHYRAGLPKATNEELLDFIHDLIIPPLPKFFGPNLLVVSIWFTLLFAAGIYILIRKIVKGTFWIFKRRSNGNGTLILIEPSIGFMLLEGSFVIIYLVKNWFQISMSRHSFSVLNFGFITLLDALPLLGGGWAALWGVVFLFPQVNFRKRIWRAGRHPWASNIFVIATPLIVLGLTLVSMIWQGIVRRDAILRWRDWRVELENDPAAFPTSAQLEEASVIWQRVAISYRIWALSWFFWFFVGYIFAALIAFLGVSLRETLSAQLELRSDVDSMGEALGSLAARASVINGNLRTRVLRRTLKLVMCLAISLFIGSVGFGTMALYHSLTMYKAFSTGPREGGLNLAIEAVWSGWVGVSIGTPIFFLITSSLFEETMGKWRSVKSDRENSKSFPMNAKRSDEELNVQTDQFSIYALKEEPSITDSSTPRLDSEDRRISIQLEEEKPRGTNRLLGISTDELNSREREGSIEKSKEGRSRETSHSGLEWEGREEDEGRGEDF